MRTTKFTSKGKYLGMLLILSSITTISTYAVFIVKVAVIYSYDSTAVHVNLCIYSFTGSYTPSV